MLSYRTVLSDSLPTGVLTKDITSKKFDSLNRWVRKCKPEASESSLKLLYPQTKVGDILDSGPSRRRRRNFLVDAITQKQINIFFSNLVHMLRVPKGRSLF